MIFFHSSQKFLKIVLFINPHVIICQNQTLHYPLSFHLFLCRNMVMSLPKTFPIERKPIIIFRRKEIFRQLETNVTLFMLFLAMKKVQLDKKSIWRKSILNFQSVFYLEDESLCFWLNDNVMLCLHKMHLTSPFFLFQTELEIN